MTLPVDLLRFRRRKGIVIPLYADETKLSLAKTLISVFKDNLGKKYRDLKDSLDSCENLGYNYKLVRGLRFVLEKRCILGSKISLNPVEIRRAIFERVGNRVITSKKMRQEIFSKVSSKFGVDSLEIEDALYADLSEEQRILEFTSPEPMELLKEYNFALITGILTQSYQMELIFKGMVERPSLKLGESIVFSEGDFKKIILKMYSTKYSKSRISELEKVIAQLVLQDDWRIKAEIRQSSRNYFLEVSKEKHGRLLNSKKCYQVSQETPKLPLREKQLPDVIIVEELATSQGITEAIVRELLRRRGDFADLGNIFVSKSKLDLIIKILERQEKLTLRTVLEAFKKMKCQHPIQVLEALGYSIEWAENRGESKVYRIKR